MFSSNTRGDYQRWSDASFASCREELVAAATAELKQYEKIWGGEGLARKRQALRSQSAFAEPAPAWAEGFFEFIGYGKFLNLSRETLQQMAAKEQDTHCGEGREGREGREGSATPEQEAGEDIDGSTVGLLKDVFLVALASGQGIAVDHGLFHHGWDGEEVRLYPLSHGDVVYAHQQFARETLQRFSQTRAKLSHSEFISAEGVAALSQYLQQETHGSHFSMGGGAHTLLTPFGAGWAIDGCFNDAIVAPHRSSDNAFVLSESARFALSQYVRWTNAFFWMNDLRRVNPDTPQDGPFDVKHLTEGTLAGAMGVYDEAGFSRGGGSIWYHNHATYQEELGAEADAFSLALLHLTRLWEERLRAKWVDIGRPKVWARSKAAIDEDWQAMLADNGYAMSQQQAGEIYATLASQTLADFKALVVDSCEVPEASLQAASSYAEVRSAANASAEDCIDGLFSTAETTFDEVGGNQDPAEAEAWLRAAWGNFIAFVEERFPHSNLQDKQGSVVTLAELLRGVRFDVNHQGKHLGVSDAVFEWGTQVPLATHSAYTQMIHEGFHALIATLDSKGFEVAHGGWEEKYTVVSERMLEDELFHWLSSESEKVDKLAALDAAQVEQKRAYDLTRYWPFRRASMLSTHQIMTSTAALDTTSLVSNLNDAWLVQDPQQRDRAQVRSHWGLQYSGYWLGAFEGHTEIEQLKQNHNLSMQITPYDLAACGYFTTSERRSINWSDCLAP